MHKRPGVILQLDSGTHNYTLFSLTCASEKGVSAAVGGTAYTYTVSNTNYTFSTEQEYWSIPSALLTKLKTTTTGTQLAIVGNGSKDWPASGPVRGFPDASGLQTAQFARIATGWTTSSAPTNLFTTATTGTVTLATAISFANLTFTNNAWSGSIDWYVVATATPTGSVIGPDATVTLLYSPTTASAATGSSWYKLTTSVEATVPFAL